MLATAQSKMGEKRMDIMSAVVRKVFIPLWALKSGTYGELKYHNFFHSLASLSTTEILARQRARLQHIVVHAYENTDYYRAAFDASGFSPYQLAEINPLQNVPLLTKVLIRTNFDKLFARGFAASDIVRNTTGSSTGTPLSYAYNKECVFMRKGQELYFDRWMGYRPGDKIALFVAAAHHDNIAQRWRAKLRNATNERMLRFDPHHITDEYMREFANEFVAYKPTMIKCFPNSLAIFADFVRRERLVLPPVRTISCTGENLYPHQKQLFRETFGGEVFEKYGTKECGVIASECREHAGMHVFAEGVFLEILDGNSNPVSPGESGRVVVTDLFNRGFPLIRYEIGDMAVAREQSPCRCGDPLPMIDRLIGRDRDILVDGDGNPKPGYLFVDAISRMNLVDAQFQVVQQPNCDIVIKVVNVDKNAVDIQSLVGKFREIVGPKLPIMVEHVESIPRDPSGKYRYVISLRNPSPAVK
ncbi:MAG: AMP-binding protein [Gammaproteobacteria bacterium]